MFARIAGVARVRTPVNKSRKHKTGMEKTRADKNKFKNYRRCEV
jgi:hypothetical protein